MFTNDSKINQLFNNLDTWRHLPAYQLERRADIFFSLYLAEVLQKKFGLSGAPILIPEFPIQYGLIPKLKGSAGENQSFKIDYLAAGNDEKGGLRAFFIELKTDNNSIGQSQVANMHAASSLSLKTLISVIPAMQKKSKAKEKYEQLKIQTNNIENWNSIPTIVFIMPKTLIEKQLNTLDNDARDAFEKSAKITFDEFATIVEKHPDYLSLRFAKSLREWANDEAG